MERADHRDLRRHKVARAREGDAVDFDVECTDVFQKKIGVFLAERAHILKGERETLALEPCSHLVSAFISIRCEMTKVCKIDDLLYCITVVFERSPQNVGKNK